MARLSDAMIQIKNLEGVPTEDEINEFMNNILIGGSNPDATYSSPQGEE